MDNQKYNFIRENKIVFQSDFPRTVKLKEVRSDLESNDVLTAQEYFFSLDKNPYKKEKEDTIPIDSIAYYPSQKHKDEPPLPRVIIGPVRIGVSRSNKPLTWITCTEEEFNCTLKTTRDHLEKNQLMHANDFFLKEGIPWPKAEEKTTRLLEFVEDNKLPIGVPERKPQKEKIAAPELPDDETDLPVEIPDAVLPDKELDRTGYDIEDFDVSNELTPSDIYELVVHNNLMNGIYVGSTAPHVVTGLKAYEFNEDAQNNIILYRKDDTSIISELTYTERASNFVRSGFSKINATLSTPWASGSMEAAKKEKTAHNERSSSFYVTGKWRCPRVTIALPVKLFKPVDIFVKEITEALDGDDKERKFARLQKVFYKYGHFIPVQATLGGELVTTKQEVSKAETDAHYEEGKIRAAVATEIGSFFSANAGYQEKTVSQDGSEVSSTFKKEQLFAKGGNTLLANAPGEWLKSLGNYKNWRIISYDKIVPIYYLLKNIDSGPDDRDLVAEINEILNSHLLKEIRDIWGLAVAPHGDIYAVTGLHSGGMWKFDAGFQAWEHISFPDIDFENYGQNHVHSYGFFSDIAIMKDGMFALNHYFPRDTPPLLNSYITFFSPFDENRADPLRGVYLDHFTWLRKVPVYNNKICLLPSSNGIAAIKQIQSNQWTLHLYLDPFVFKQQDGKNPVQKSKSKVDLKTDHPELEDMGKSMTEAYAFKKHFGSTKIIPLPDNGYPLSVAAFRDGEILVLVGEKQDKNHKSRKLLCLHNDKWEKVPNDIDILAIAEDVDDGLIAIKAESYRDDAEFPFKPSFTDVAHPRNKWLGNRVIRWYGWQSYIGKEDPPPNPWDPAKRSGDDNTGWSEFDPWERREQFLK